MFSHSSLLDGVCLISPPAYQDERGEFRPVFAQRLHVSEGIPTDWAEMNVSHTHAGCVRGLHFQTTAPQAKLITVISGEIFDVVVDLRPTSPTCGRWASFMLSAASGPSQIFVPAGFAHGFATSNGPAIVAYLVSEPWMPEAEQVLAWDDPTLAIPWPLNQPILSARDLNAQCLANVLACVSRQPLI